MPTDMSLNKYTFIERPAPEGGVLFFTFHGTGGNENQFFELAQNLFPSAHVIATRGDVSEHSALRYFKRKAEGVYDMEDLAIRTKALAEFIEAHKRRTKASRVIGLGYSNGANILAAVMFSAPDLFDDAVLMHPLIPWVLADEAKLAGKRVLITAGKHDPICPAPLSEKLNSYFVRQGSETKLVWHDGGHELRQTEIEEAAAFLRP
jgi:phospholipase/carboxylesterase